MRMLLLLIVLSMISLLSIIKLKERMNVINMLGCYMFSNIAITITGIIINLNLKLTQTPKESIVFWTHLKEMQQHPIKEYLIKTINPLFVLQGVKDVQVSVEKEFKYPLCRY